MNEQPITPKCPVCENIPANCNCLPEHLTKEVEQKPFFDKRKINDQINKIAEMELEEARDLKFRRPLLDIDLDALEDGKTLKDKIEAFKTSPLRFSKLKPK